MSAFGLSSKSLTAGSGARRIVRNGPRLCKNARSAATRVILKLREKILIQQNQSLNKTDFDAFGRI